jgi:hypothetical protein
MKKPISIPVIISGGQTGVDRAALDWAIGHRISHGGWCPKGRLADDGVISLAYSLKETPSSDCSQRTESNVRDSDGTVIFSLATQLSGGSKYTMEMARHHLKPVLHLSAQSKQRHAAALQRFVMEQNIKRLNVAGSRESGEPQVAQFVRRVLEETFYPDDDYSSTPRSR